MSTIEIADLEQDTDEILDRVKAGESITIVENGEPAARLIPFSHHEPGEPLDSGSVLPAG